MSQDSSPLSRAQLLRSVPANVGFVAAAGVVIGVTKPALAALPTPDDYAFGTGSKVCMLLFSQTRTHAVCFTHLRVERQSAKLKLVC